MPGTALACAVTSAKKKLELVIPVVLLVPYELVIGILLMWQDSSTGSIIFISGLGLVSSSTIALMTASIQSRPDVQLFGESFPNGMTCAVLALIQTPWKLKVQDTVIFVALKIPKKACLSCTKGRKCCL
jgi:hypothetical protein